MTLNLCYFKFRFVSIYKKIENYCSTINKKEATPIGTASFFVLFFSVLICKQPRFLLFANPDYQHPMAAQPTPAALSVVTPAD